MGNLDPILNDFSKQEVIDALAEIRHPFEIAVVGIGNEWNLGAIIRTAHNYLAKKIWGIDIDWYYPKASMSALKFEKPTIKMESLQNFLELNHDRNIVCFEKRSSIKSEDIRTFEYPKDPILVFGSERTGCPDELLKAASHIVTIPCFGLVNDYNVSVAAGIAMFDFTNKWWKNGSTRSV